MGVERYGWTRAEGDGGWKCGPPCLVRSLLRIPDGGFWWDSVEPG
jgi:hypothetical protein